MEQAIVESFALAGLVRSALLVCVACAGPLVVALALARGIAIPELARVLGRKPERSSDRVELALGWVLAAVVVVALQTALGLVFDARYRDFPAAALTAAVLPFGLLWVTQGRTAGVRPAAEMVAAVMLAGSAIYIAINETFANWQSLWTCAALLVLALILERSRAARG